MILNPHFGIAMFYSLYFIFSFKHVYWHSVLLILLNMLLSIIIIFVYLKQSDISVLEFYFRSFNYWFVFSLINSFLLNVSFSCSIQSYFIVIWINKKLTYPKIIQSVLVNQHKFRIVIILCKKNTKNKFVVILTS